MSILVIFWMVFSQQDYQNSFSDYRILNQQNLQLCCILKIGWHKSGLVVLACVIFFLSVRSLEYDQCMERKNLFLQKHFSACCFSIALPLCLQKTWLMILNYKGLVTCQWQIDMMGSWTSPIFTTSQYWFLLSQSESRFHIVLDALKWIFLDTPCKIDSCWKLREDIGTWWEIQFLW